MKSSSISAKRDSRILLDPIRVYEIKIDLESAAEASLL